MAISMLQHKSIEFANVASGGLAFTSNVTAGSSIVCAGSAFSSAFGATPFTDSKSQTYTVDQSNLVNGTDNICGGSTTAAAAGATTVTIHPGSTSDCTLAIHEVAGFTTMVKDVQATGTGNSSSEAVGPTATPTAANEFCIAAMTNDGSTTSVTVASPYTIAESQTSATHMPLATATNIISSAAAQTATFTWATANYRGFLITYKESGGGASAPFPPWPPVEQSAVYRM